MRLPEAARPDPFDAGASVNTAGKRHSRTRIGVPERDSENAALEAIVRAALGPLSMKIIRSYSMQFEADLARIALEGADIPAVVVGVGMGMEGGIGGVQLLVPEDRIEAALKVLKEFEDQDEHLE
jgi:Putative prokaryotic signal transducing protein